MNGIQLHRAPSASTLAEAFAAVLDTPRLDPFVADLVVVPNAGTQRWLSQSLARRLGPAGEGICAGIDFTSLERLIRRVRRELALPDDPWRADTLVGVLLAVLARADLPTALDPVQAHLAGSRERISVVRRLASLFVNYAHWRPAMVARWVAGADVDAEGNPLGFDAWQASLWRLVVAELEWEPGEQQQTLLAAILDQSRPVGLPASVSLFLPGALSPTDVAFLEALGQRTSVALWLAGSPDSTHQLNQRLGRAAAEAVLPRGEVVHHATVTGSRPRLLDWLKDDLITGTASPEGRLLAADDTSIQLHASHGLDRQVEVLRDAITSLMAADETLQPRDIVIACADLNAAVPLINAAFQLPPSFPTRHPGCEFRVQVADRSAAEVNPLVGVLTRVLRLATSRAEVSEVVDLLAQPAVAARLGLHVDDLDRAAELIGRAGVRWGLGRQQRARFGLANLPHNTWLAGLQRLLLGVALSEDDLPTVKTVLPVDDVDSSDVALIGALAELISRLTRAAAAFETPTSVTDWVERLRTAVDSVALCTGDEAWQRAHLWLGLGQLPSCQGAPVTLSEIAALVEHQFAETPARPPFGNGSLTVCSLGSVRHLPHRVVCLLGLDDGVFPRPPAADGDDLMLRAPRPGDPDRTLTDRQSLLDAILAARDHLVITYQGHTISTNDVVHPPAALSDLTDALDATARRSDGARVSRAVPVGAGAGTVIEHRLQPFDPTYFIDGGQSFDVVALKGAQALITATTAVEASVAVGPAPRATAVSLTELSASLAHSARYFEKARLGLSPAWANRNHDELPIELNGLDRWAIGSRMLSLARAGHPLDQVVAAEWLRGSLPPKQLGTQLAGDLRSQVEQVLRGLPAPAARHVHDVNLEVGGVRVTGRVHVEGDSLLTAEFSRLQARHRLQAWVRLVAAAAAGAPVRRALVVARGTSCELKAPTPEVALTVLQQLLSLHQASLDRPLPLTPRVGEVIAETIGRGRDPFGPDTRALARAWEFDSDEVWQRYYPTLAALLAVPNDGPITFGHPEHGLTAALARALWDPLLAHEVRP